MISRLEQPKLSVSLQGHLLVAAPHLEDQLFARSVCLVVHHNNQGAIGVFLNKELDIHAPTLWKQLAGQEAQYSKSLLHLGGPNSGPVIAVHSHEPLAEYTSARGVYFAAQIDHLRQLLHLATDPAKSEQQAVKIIVGQANWAPGQLESEFQTGKWLPLAVSSKVVFAERHLMWHQAIREVGNLYVASLVGCNAVPPSPLLN